jgi:ribosomal RNA-processing protein 17
MAPQNKKAPRAADTKRRRPNPQVESLTFDPEARNEWLTGFRKRKQQRIKHAQEQSAKIEKEEKVQARKQVRGENEREGRRGKDQKS